MGKFKAGLVKVLNGIPGKWMLQQLLRPLHPPRRFTNSFPYTGTVRVAVDEWHSFRIFSGASLCFWEGLEGTGEAHSLRVWAAFCRDARCVFDVGAHAGLFSLTAAAMNSELDIHAFEPLPGNFRNLQRNAEGNGFSNIQPYCVGVSARSGEGRIHFDEEDATIATMEMRGLKKHLDVPLVALDKFMRDHQLATVDAVKIDVELHELCVLEGMRDVLRNSAPVMVIEVLNDEIGRGIRVLAGPDYRAYFIDERGSLELRSTLQRIDKQSTNYLMLPPNRFAQWEQMSSSLNLKRA